MGTNQRRHRVFVKQIVFLFALIVGGYFLIQNYLTAAKNAQFVNVQFQLENSKDTPIFRLEVVAAPKERAKGLMFRRLSDMSEDQGMLFIFPDEMTRTFWMKNTLIPLDMIFIGADLKVAGVVPNTTPLSEEARGVGKPSKYVIELLGGMAKKHGISTGAVVKLPPGLPPAK